MEKFVEFINSKRDSVTQNKSKDLNGLVFAFVGDAVFGLFVRGLLASKSTAKAGVLHGLAVKFVRASYQCELLDKIWDNLTEQEKQIATNARNAKTNNIAKNSNLMEYKKSTAFEAVIGYLYITKQNDRLIQVLDSCKVYINEVLNKK